MRGSSPCDMKEDPALLVEVISEKIDAGILTDRDQSGGIFGEFEFFIVLVFLG